jgi:MFS family permease
MGTQPVAGAEGPTSTVLAVRTRSLIVVFGLVGGFLASGYGVLFTLLDEFRDEHGISESALGGVIGIGFIAGFVAQVTIAPLADRGHARRLVLLGMLLDIVGLLVMAFSESIGPLLAGRFVMGVGVGMAIPAIRRIVIVADHANLGHNLGRLLAADVAGFAAGPAVSALLVGPFGIPAPFLFIAGATVLLLPLVARTHVTESVAAPGTAAAQRFAFDLLRLRPFAAAVALGSAVWLMIGAFDALWSLALDDLDSPEWLANLGITLFALPLVVLGAAGGRLAQRVGPFRVGTVGLLLGAGYMAMYGFMPSGVAMFAVAMAHALSDGLTVSSTGVAVGLVVPQDRQAGAQGVLGGIQTLTAGVTAPIIGALYEHAGRDVAYAASAVAMVVLVVIGVLLAGPAWRLRDERTAGARDELASADLADPTVVAGGTLTDGS